MANEGMSHVFVTILGLYGVLPVNYILSFDLVYDVESFYSL